MISQNDILTFSNLFSCATEFYGTTIVGEIVEGKAQSTSTCIHEPVSPAIISRHLAGEQSIGLSPLKADNTVMFGAIDIDNYTGNLQNIINAIYDFELPICPCYSKSKKLHLYFFFEMGSEAEEAVKIMRWYARAFACEKKVEVFPKQIARSMSNKAYSWINLPYYNEEDENNHRKMVLKDGSLASLSMFLDRAKNCRFTIDKHNEVIKRIPCYDAPPCILTGIILRDVGAGGRNNWLYSVATYFKLKDENCDLDTLMEEVNNSLIDPLPEDELKGTVLKSLQRKTCFYLCSALADRCDKVACSHLEYGVGSNKSTGLEYGSLTQYMNDPPYYKWQVNGQDMMFYSEQELLGQSQFQVLCLRQLHIVPRRVDDKIWAKIITKACANITVVYPDTKGGDFSVGSRFYDLACAYFGDKRKAANFTQVFLGRVFEDTQRKEYVFTSSSFLTYMQESKSFKGLSQMEMRTRLEELGAYKSGNVWRLPTSAIPQEDMKQPDIEIDYNNGEGESEDF